MQLWICLDLGLAWIYMFGECERVCFKSSVEIGAVKQSQKQERKDPCRNRHV